MIVERAYAEVNGARLYYERAGTGPALLMLHAGIADCRMWDGEFSYFANSRQVTRFDMRGYGKSLPVPGDFNIEDDLVALIDRLDLALPLVLMGCSMGGGLAVDYALARPDDVAALALVGSGPAGLELEAPGPDELFAQSEAAFAAGDIERVAELDMRIWFDGMGRGPDDVDAAARQKAFEMARLVTTHELSGIGNHGRKARQTPAAQRLHELDMPALVAVGENDLPYLRMAADYMRERMPRARKLLVPGAGHLPNMERPELFQAELAAFLAAL